MSDPHIAAQLAGESGAKPGGTLFSRCLSDENAPGPAYIAMIRHIARMLAQVLKEQA